MEGVSISPLSPVLPGAKLTRRASAATMGISSSMRPTVAGMKNASAVATSAIATSRPL